MFDQFCFLEKKIIIKHFLAFGMFISTFKTLIRTIQGAERKYVNVIKYYGTYKKFVALYIFIFALLQCKSEGLKIK